MYKPLPEGLTIQDSDIDGLGVVATKKIKANTVLGIIHVVNKNFPHGHIRTALGSFYNHSDDPNCVVLDGYWQQISVKYLVTQKDIKENEELTAKYSLYAINEHSGE
jgi:SET domain-containing protein